DAPDPGLGYEHQPAEEAGEDQECESRVPERLGVDAAEAVDATQERNTLERRRHGRTTDLNGHGLSPPPPRCRTGRGMCPPGSAPGLRNRPARSAPPS